MHKQLFTFTELVLNRAVKTSMVPSILSVESLSAALSMLKPSTQIDENRELTIGVSERQIRG